MNSMGGMPFLNSNYTLLAEVPFPIHNPTMESTLTTLYIFDITDTKADELMDIDDPYLLSVIVKEDLDVWDDNGPVPGAVFHRFRVEMPDSAIVYLYDEEALSI